MVIPTAKTQDAVLANAMKAEPRIFSFLKPGDIADGKVLEKRAKMLMVDLGKHGTGVVYQSEMQNARDMVKNLAVGEAVQAKVIDVDNEEGLVELSLAEAGRQRAWTEIGELREKDEPFMVTIIGFNKGGLLAEVAGVPAFLPVSQLAGDHYPKASPDSREALAGELGALVGAQISVRILDAIQRTNKLIISEREAVEVSTRELVKNYKVDQIIEGIVSGVADFGVFVKFTDNPAVEGLVHVSELDWRMVENPKEVVHIDDVVKAKIIDIKDGKISLSIKALKEDPWVAAESRYEEGQSVRGTVYAFVPFGAIVSLDGGLQGQVHVSGFGSLEEMKRTLSQGKEYEFAIESVRAAERRITLKFKK